MSEDHQVQSLCQKRKVEELSEVFVIAFPSKAGGHATGQRSSVAGPFVFDRVQDPAQVSWSLGFSSGKRLLFEAPSIQIRYHRVA